ncbi:GDP-mannose 4,6-dehydratase [Candidatus Omnitrophota bacterium]
MDYWKDKKVFVTGCNGFLGSWLAKTLVDRGARVTGLIRDEIHDSFLVSSGSVDKINLVYGVVQDYELIERVLNEHDIDTCFHLAAQAIVEVANRGPLSTFKTNIQGGWNILEAARRCPDVKRIAIASSDKAYGSHNRLPYTEEFNLQGRHPYDASKSCLDILAQMYFHTYGLPLAISRSANIYGPGDLNFSRIIPDTIRALILDQRPIIRSDGKFIRDYIFVQDAVESYLTLAEHLDRKQIQGQAFNFGNQQPINVLDLVEKIIAISGKQNLKPQILSTAKYEIKEQHLDTKKAQDVLKWRPQYSLDQGLRKTYAWYERYLNGEAK